MQEAGINKNETKRLELEILLSVKTNNDEHSTLLGLVGIGSSKSLGKREVIQTTKGVVTTADERAKWKTKAGAFKTKESSSVGSMKLPQFANRREFDIEKPHLHGDPGEKHDAIIGQDACHK